MRCRRRLCLRIPSAALGGIFARLHIFQGKAAGRVCFRYLIGVFIDAVQRNLRIRNRGTGGILNSAANTSKRRLAKTTAGTQEHRKDCNCSSRHAKPMPAALCARCGGSAREISQHREATAASAAPARGQLRGCAILLLRFQDLSCISPNRHECRLGYVKSQPTREA